MSKKNKNEKTQRQLEIDQLDEMLWRSTPLGKFLSTIKRKASRDSRSGAVTYKTEKRSWVVRIPSAFVFTGAKTGGFQTIVMAETRDQAWEEASKCDEWEILDFFISHMKVFPQDPL